KDFSLPQDVRTWYFGNIDSQRIAFSRGQNLLSPMTPHGRRAIRNPDYALQDFWEEAVGNIQSYSSLWSNIAVTGAYAQ
ncbi:MAG: transcription factor, partial [Treponema sp.]|nr:transcription factor [Treponema sp.]